MEVIESLSIPRGGTIQLCWGGLAGLGPADGCDLIIVSAFRGDYLATPGSVIGALYRRGLSVADLAANPGVDLRSSTSCWLSREISGNRGTLGFDRILLYEPNSPSSAAETVGDVFRALVPFVVGTKAIRDVAMPVLSTGDMGRRQDEMLPAILSAAWQWMSQGLELDRLRIVVRGDAGTPARKTFRDFAQQLRHDGMSWPEVSSGAGSQRSSRRVGMNFGRHRAASARRKQHSKYDAFVSYARKDGRDIVNVIEREMTKRAPDIRLFIDDQSIDVGSSWQSEIATSIATCRKFVAVSTAGFWESKVCVEEWNMANVMRRKRDDSFIFPIEAKSCESDLKLLFDTLNFRDCKEADRSKLQEACSALAAELVD